MGKKFGFLRETTEAAIKAGLDADTGLHRTGLNEYLAVIFPDTNDWIHDKAIGMLNDGTLCRKRPDYRSESLKLIVEFDGLQHYQKPTQILQDIENTKLYESFGYKVVRIPYFIQLTNDVVKQLFGVNVDCELFDETYPSLDETNGPAWLVSAGIKRMADDLRKFPEQLKVNVHNLLSLDNEFLTGVSLLLKELNVSCEEAIQFGGAT